MLPSTVGSTAERRPFTHRSHNWCVSLLAAPPHDTTPHHTPHTMHPRALYRLRLRLLPPAFCGGQLQQRWPSEWCATTSRIGSSGGQRTGPLPRQRPGPVLWLTLQRVAPFTILHHHAISHSRSIRHSHAPWASLPATHMPPTLAYLVPFRAPRVHRTMLQAPRADTL